MKKIVLVLILAAFSSIIVLKANSVNSPESVTSASMHMIKRRILKYVNIYNALPEGLSDLPTIGGFSNCIRDGWGREIIFEIDYDDLAYGDLVSLISYGKDGIEGGDGKDVDIVGIFPVKNEDGQWLQGLMCKWIESPLADEEIDGGIE